MDEVITSAQLADKRIDLLDRLLAQIEAVPVATLDADNVAALVDILCKWLKTSNFKQSLVGLQCCVYLSDVVTALIANHLHSMLPLALERLGDTKEQIRDLCMNFFTILLENLPPQQVFDYLAPGLKHKNPKVRTQVMALLEAILQKSGAASIALSKLTVDLCALLSDPNEQVREAANSAVVMVYRYVGERFKQDIEKKDAVPVAKRPPLFKRFEQVQTTGGMMVSETPGVSRSASFTKPLSKQSSGAASTTSSTTTTSATTTSAVSLVPVVATLPKRALTIIGSTAKLGTEKGGLDEQAYNDAVQQSEPIYIRSASELEELKFLIPVLSDDKTNVWEPRVAALIRIRGLAAGNAPSYENFVLELRTLTDAFCICTRDLRSSVNREASLTISKLAEVLGDKFEPFIEPVVTELFKQVIINVKVIADAANLCTRYIVKSTHSRTLLLKLMEQVDAKSVTLRRRVCEYMFLALEEWESAQLSKNVTAISKYLFRTTSDADSVVRATARKAYWLFEGKFREQAQALFTSLDQSKQKMLMDERGKVGGLDDDAASAAAASASAAPRPRATAIARPPLKTAATIAGTSAVRTEAPAPGIVRAATLTSTMLASTKFRSRETSSEYGSPHKADDISDSISDISFGSAASFPRTPKRDSLANTYPGKSPSSASRTSLTGSTTSLRPPTTTAQRVTKPTITKPEPTTTTGAQRVQRPAISPVARAATAVSRLNAAKTPARSAPVIVVDPLAPILALSASTDWAQRMDAVNRLRVLLLNEEGSLSEALVARIAEYFSKQFEEPHKNVFAQVIDLLGEFVPLHVIEGPWMTNILSNLFIKIGTDIPTATQSKVQIVFAGIRRTYPPDTQLTAVFSFFVATKTFGLVKIKQALAEYTIQLIPFLTEDIFNSVHATNPNDILTAIERLAEWTQDPKSQELRKSSAMLILQLYALNTQKFVQITKDLSFRPGLIMRGILDNHHPGWSTQTQGAPARSAPATVTVPLQLTGASSTSSLAPPQQSGLLRANSADRLRMPSPTPSNTTPSLRGTLSASLSPSVTPTPGDQTGSPSISSAATPMPSSSGQLVGHGVPTTITNSVISTSRIPGPPAHGSSSPNPGTPPTSRADRVQSPIQRTSSIPLIRRTSSESSVEGRTVFRRGSELLADSRPRPFVQAPTLQTVASGTTGTTEAVKYNPSHYQDDALDRQYLRTSSTASDDDGPATPLAFASTDLRAALTALSENLTNDTSSTESTLQWLHKIARERNASVWSHMFAAVLGVVLALFGDPDPRIRELSLKVLREMLRHQAQYLEGHEVEVLHKLLERHKDTSTQVLRVAEEALNAFSAAVAPPLCCDLIIPILNDNENTPSIMLPALKLFTKGLKKLTPDDLRGMGTRVIACLFKGYRNPAAEVRKAVVFALVEVHILATDVLGPHLAQLTSSQLKLLQIYIKKAEGKLLSDQEPVISASSTV
eukprot:m.785452 g.785452  ORF g.785452 m.785452 type:complete len:1457 (+) comp59166_c0_seq2:165-4535(+)